MAEVAIPTMPILIKHVVYKWGVNNGGYWFDQSPSGFYGKSSFIGTPYVGNGMLLVPIDPLTAIGLGLVTPEELSYPEGILAAFLLLKGNS